MFFLSPLVLFACSTNEILDDYEESNAYYDSNFIISELKKQQTNEFDLSDIELNQLLIDLESEIESDKEMLEILKRYFSLTDADFLKLTEIKSNEDELFNDLITNYGIDFRNIQSKKSHGLSILKSILNYSEGNSFENLSSTNSNQRSLCFSSDNFPIVYNFVNACICNTSNARGFDYRQSVNFTYGGTNCYFELRYNTTFNAIRTLNPKTRGVIALHGDKVYGNQDKIILDPILMGVVILTPLEAFSSIRVKR